MKLNRFETFLMNNPIRAFLQRYYEAPRLARLAVKPLEGAKTLIIGCGRGVDIEIAFDVFGVREVTAVDLDEAQIGRAQKLLGNKYGDRLNLREADATKIPCSDGNFDLVLDFGIIHHIPQWREAIREVYRLLKSGGQFLFEEVPGHKLNSFRYRILAEHPGEDRFEAKEFKNACEETGLVIDRRLEIFFGFFRGAAVKKENK